MIERGRECWERGDLQVAERLLRRAAEEDPTGKSSLLLGDFLLDTSFPEEAEPVFRGLLHNQPRSVELLLRLARCLVQQDRYGTACRTISKVLCLEPLHTEALHLLTSIAHRTKSYRRVESHLYNLTQTFPRAPEPYLALVSLHEGRKNLAAAKKVLAHGLRKNRFHPLLLNRLGIINYKKGRFSASLRCYHWALTHVRELNSTAQSGARRRIRMNLANALCMTGEIDESLAIYRKLLENNSCDPTAGINMAITLRYADRNTEARETLENLLVTTGENKRGLYWLGVIASEENALEKAEHFFRRALALDDDDLCIKLNLACVLKHQGRLKEALCLVEDALFLHPDHLEGVRLKAELLFGLNRLHEAEPILRQLASRTPDDPYPLHRLGIVNAQMGRLDEAQPWLRAALKLAPWRRKVRFDLAEVLLLDGRQDECLATLGEGLDSSNLSVVDIRANGQLDDIKVTPAYREMTDSHSLLDLANPWDGAEKRLLAVVEGLSATEESQRSRCPLWNELEPQGTLESDGTAAVRHLLRTVISDFMLARSIERGKNGVKVYVEVHPEHDGLEVRTVFHSRDEDEHEACRLSQVLFKKRNGRFLLRFHDRVPPC